MKKMRKFILLLIIATFASTSAQAVEFSTSGSYYARGSWISNDSGLQADAVDYGYYDHELDMTTTIVVDDNTRIIVNYEIHDSDWISSNHDGWNQDGASNLDDNIEFKRVFSSHTFTATGTTLDLGLMTGGAWATDFANNADGRYRVKVRQDTSVGSVFAILEKNAEVGAENSATEDAEEDDGNTYYVAMITKLGPVNVKPLLGYADRSDIIQEQGSDGLNLITFQLGLDGSYDIWGFESDFVYVGREWDTGAADSDTFGAYLKGWFKSGPAKIYGILAYGDEDEGQAFAMGDDFEPLTFLANWTAFGPVADHFSACSLYILGMDFAATDALSFNGALAFVDSNYDVAGSIWEDADAWELDLGLGYKISDAVKYSVQFGYADIDMDVNDPDGSWRLYHKFQINF